MNTTFNSRLLNRLLPRYLEPTERPEDDLPWPPEIGMLSRPRAGYRPYHLPSRCCWLQNAPEDTHILQASDWADIQQLYQSLRQAAITGNNNALNDLGWLLLNAPVSNPELAGHLLRMAAHSGSSEALYNLAEQSLYGHHATANIDLALDYYQRAAATLPEAATRLARLYLRGNYRHPHFSENTAAALYWLQQGHVAGYCWASFYLSYYWLHHSAPHAAKDVWLQRMEKLALEGCLHLAFSASYTLALYYEPHIYSLPRALREHHWWLDFSDQICSRLDAWDEHMLAERGRPHLIHSSS